MAGMADTTDLTETFSDALMGSDEDAIIGSILSKLTSTPVIED